MKYCNIDHNENRHPKPQQPASSTLLENFDKLYLTSTVASRAKTHKKEDRHLKEFTNEKSKNEDTAIQSKPHNSKHERKMSAKATPRSVATSTQTDNKENLLVSNDKCRSNQASSPVDGPICNNLT